MKALRAGSSVMIGAIELIPIETSYMRADWTAGGLVGFAAKDVEAIVIRSDNRLRAFDLEGNEISLDDLLSAVPGLREQAGERQQRT